MDEGDDSHGDMDDRGDGRKGRGSAGLPCPARIW